MCHRKCEVLANVGFKHIAGLVHTHEILLAKQLDDRPLREQQQVCQVVIYRKFFVSLLTLLDDKCRFLSH
jgi:hypothetical protein